MNKLEFMAMSLPYSLKMKSLYGFRPNGKESTGVSRISFLTADLYADIVNKIFPAEFLPILRPLSDLTKPCLYGGLTPIEELSKIAGLKNGNVDKKYDGVCICDNSSISFFFQNNSFNAGKINYIEDEWLEDKNVPNQLFLFQKLVEWHFDIAGLIEKGEAVDCHTLPDFIF